MNKSIISICFLINFLSIGMAQQCAFNLGPKGNFSRSNGNCSFTSCDDSLAIYNYHPLSEVETIEFKVRWSIFADDDGSNGRPEERIIEFLPYLNEVFKEHKIQFNTIDIATYQNTEVNHAQRSTWEDSVSYYEPYVLENDSVINILIPQDFDGPDNRGLPLFLLIFLNSTILLFPREEELL